MTTPRLLQAAWYATAQHDRPKPPARSYRGGRSKLPYVTHCFNVAERLLTAEIMELGGGLRVEDTLIAAILHDVLEDTYATPADVGGRFGASVRDVVMQLTLPPSIGRNWEAKLDHQKKMMVEMDWEGRAIKIADKTSNVHDLIADPPDWPAGAVRAYISDAKAVVEVVRRMTDKPMYIRSLISTFDSTI